MKIIKITNQHRRDFHAEVECEGCGARDRISGYDDRNYHDNVMPGMRCLACGKSRNDLGITAEPTATKHPPWEVV